MTKKFLALTTAAALGLGAVATAPTAQAQSSIDQEAPLRGSSTGSSSLDVALFTAVVGSAVKVIVDNVEGLRVAVDDVAAAIGSSHLPGSSEASRAQSGWDFNLDSSSLGSS